MARITAPQPAHRLTADVLPGEIVTRGRAITLAAGVQLAADAPHAVSVAGGPANGAGAAVTAQASALVVDTSALAPGAYSLTADRVAGVKGEPVAGLALDFTVVETAAKIDPRLAVVRASRVRIDDLDITALPLSSSADRSYIDLFKAIGRDGGELIEFAFDERGAAIDFNAAVNALGERRRARFGKLHPALRARLDRSTGAKGKGELIDVAIWLSHQGAGLPPEDAALPAKSPTRPTRRPPALERAAAKRRTAASARLAEAARELGLEVTRVDPSAPVVFGRIRADAVERLAERDEVGAVFEHDTGGQNDLADSLAISHADTVISAGTTGKGVHVAVYESGPFSLDQLSLQELYSSTLSADTLDGHHARLTSAIIKNVQKVGPHGYAPDCTLYEANSMDLDAIRWAAQDKGCTVISQSFHRDAEQTSSTLSFDDMYKDWLALHWPYPTISEAAGNGASTEFVNHKGYNRITAGSHNDDATAMASDSVFRNPSTTHADRELPETAANGTGVSAVGETMSGTSFAAPAVAGTAALVQSDNAAPLLRSWPEGTRAVLLASAFTNVAGGSYTADRLAHVDARDGSGALHASRAVAIAKSPRRTPGATAAARGWDVGTSHHGDADLIYHVSVPRFALLPRVKVALAWDSVATKTDILFLTFLGDALTVDLDLSVRDSRGAIVATSASWDNSYEIAEFAGSPGETYEVRVHRFSGTDDTWYGIAWTQSSFVFPVFTGELQLSNRLTRR